MLFSCKMKNSNQNWQGQITNLKNYGNYYEMRIESLSGITIIFGKCLLGNFVCIPDFKVGSYLAEWDNQYYNSDKLIPIMNTVDAITVVQALKTISKKIEGNI